MSRPGAVIIVLSFTLMLVVSVLSAFQAAQTPGHELTGQAAVPWFMALLVLGILYLLGFIEYANSKGYSGWLAFWLCLGQLPGFIALLLLPDQNRK